MGYRKFDRSRLTIRPLAGRRNDLALPYVQDLREVSPEHIPPGLHAAAARMVEARRNNRTVILLMGAHVIRAGVQRYLIRMMEERLITCLAMNGAGIIHDYETALIGTTTESVAHYIKDGRFGLWFETGVLNDIIAEAYLNDPGAGLGEAVGRAIEGSNFPCRADSLLAAAYRLAIPATVHVGLGYDIIHAHPNCDGAATGQLSYNDFLTLAAEVENLEGGVVLNCGTAVMGPEVFLKALSMARNVAHRSGREIRHFTTVVSDLHDLPGDFRKEPEKGTPAYFFRPWKTLLVRTVSEGGESYYVKGSHGEVIPALWSAVHYHLREKTCENFSNG